MGGQLQDQAVLQPSPHPPGCNLEPTVGGWVVPKSGLDIFKKRKISCPPYNLNSNHPPHRLTTLLTTLSYTKQCGPLDALSHFQLPVRTDQDTVHTLLPCFYVTINCVTLLLPCKDSFSRLCLTVPLVLTQLFLPFTLSKFDAYKVDVVVTTLHVTLATQLCHTLTLWLW